MKSKNVALGIICGIMAGVCWGFSGVAGQYLFESKGIDSTWLVPVRLLSSGIILMAIVNLRKRAELKVLISCKRDMLRALCAGIFGVMALQFTFFGAVQRTNAGTATVLQYLCPVITMIYVCLRSLKKPEIKELAAVIMAVAGVFIVSTHGNLHELVLTKEGLIWGLACAFSMFLNTVLPEKLYEKYSTDVVLSIGMLAGGIIMFAVFRPWETAVVWDAELILALEIIVGGGSICSYYLYGIAVNNIGPTKTSLLASVEVVAAAVPASLWLKTVYSSMDLIGFGLIIGTLFVINAKKNIGAKLS